MTKIERRDVVRAKMIYYCDIDVIFITSCKISPKLKSCISEAFITFQQEPVLYCINSGLVSTLSISILQYRNMIISLMIVYIDMAHVEIRLLPFDPSNYSQFLTAPATRISSPSIVSTQSSASTTPSTGISILNSRTLILLSACALKDGLASAYHSTDRCLIQT